MEIVGTQRIAAAREAVWTALNDPEVLRRCLPGCQSVERASAEEFKVVVVAAIGPLRAKFNGTLRMTEAHPPVSCVMVFEGQGGPAGFGQGSAAVALREIEGATELSYTAQAQVGGKLAQIGSRLIDSVAKKMSDDFFKAFLNQFQPAAAIESAAVVPAVPAVSATAAPAPGALSATAPQQTVADRSASTPSATPSTLVPGWWLAVAAVLGSALTIAGALALR